MRWMLLQSGTGVTKWDDCYKVGSNKRGVKTKIFKDNGGDKRWLTKATVAIPKEVEIMLLSQLCQIWALLYLSSLLLLLVSYFEFCCGVFAA